MNILMISIGDAILQKPLGDEVERHLEYARQANGQIHMITYSPAKHKFSARSFEDTFFVYPSSSSHQFTFPYDAYRKACALCQRLNFDVIYTQDPFGTAWAGTWLRKRFGIPLIVGNHSNFVNNSLWIAERPFFFSLLNRLAHHTLPRADAWRILNETERDVYTSQLHLPVDRIYILNTPVALERFKTPINHNTRCELRHKLRIPLDSPVLLWIGRPVRFKRLPVLLKAFRQVIERVPEAKLVLVGNRKLQQESLGKIIEELNLTSMVIWIEAGLSHAELPAYYQMADVYAHSSHFEGFGKVMVEAAANGLPVVATDTAGARRIIQDRQTGFLVPVDDAEAFAESVIWLFKHPQGSRLMGEKGRKYVLEHFDQERDIEKIVTMWRQVTEEHQGRAKVGDIH